MNVQTGAVTTKVPARLDRLPWPRWHWMIVIGLFSSLGLQRQGHPDGAGVHDRRHPDDAAGLVEVFLGAKAERKSLEDIAKPLTATDAEAGRSQARATT